MTQIQLLDSSGVGAVDAAVRMIVDITGSTFPGRICGYYLVGSYAAGEAIPNSDIDLIILFKGDITPEEQGQFAQARAECRRRSLIALDLILDNEARLMRVGAVWFQTTSRLLYGEDIRPLVPRKPVTSHIRDLMHSVWPLLARVRGDTPMFPLDYPDPQGEVYGYDQRVRKLAGREHMRTKDMVSNVLAGANALALLAAGQYVGSGKKSDIADQYRVWVGDEWAGLVEDVYMRCRNQWHYTLPQADADRVVLRDLCQRALGFENHFLAHYRSFLLAELRSSAERAVQWAAQRLELIYPFDPEVVAALKKGGV